jgi:Cu/Ag efflux protein CusF
MNKTLKSLTLIAGLMASTMFTAPAWAADSGSASMHTPTGGTSMEAMAEGEVRKIDKENQKITLKHGEITNLNMPGMTMVFKVKDPAALDRLKVGDKVRFAAEKADGSIVVTQIEAAK